jgi:hypothetical protein
LFEEIIEYVEFAVKKILCMKWENIGSLLRFAEVNERLTEKHAKFLEKEFCRERL